MEQEAERSYQAFLEANGTSDFNPFSTDEEREARSLLERLRKIARESRALVAKSRGRRGVALEFIRMWTVQTESTQALASDAPPLPPLLADGLVKLVAQTEGLDLLGIGRQLDDAELAAFLIVRDRYWPASKELTTAGVLRAARVAVRKARSDIAGDEKVSKAGTRGRKRET